MITELSNCMFSFYRSKAAIVRLGMDLILPRTSVLTTGDSGGDHKVGR